MRKELQEIEIIENYLMGKMNAAEKAEFEKQLETDANLAESVELQKILMSGLERIGLKKDLQIAKRNLFLRKVWTWFGVVLMLSAIGFLGYTNFVTLIDSRSGQNNNNLVTENDTTNFVMQNDSLAKVNGDKEFVTLSDSLAKVNGGKEFVTLNDGLAKVNGDKEFVTLSDSLAKVNGGKEFVTLSDSLAKVNGDKEFVTLSDSRSGQDFESAEIPVKQFQTFSIDPTKASSITGAEGTIIDFPANAFDTKSKEKVEIKLQEFYKLSDMVFANLTTQTAGGELIETGGMVNVEAYQGDSKLNLAGGKAINLKFPAKNKKEGMQTFLGQKDERGNIVWEEALSLGSSETYPLSQVEPYSRQFDFIGVRIADEDKRMKKMFAKQEDDVKEYLIEQFRLPSMAVSELKGFVYVSFIVEKDGTISKSIINKAGDATLKAYEYLKKTANLLPPMVPYRKEGKYVRTEFEIRIDLDKSFQSKMLGKLELEEYYKVLQRNRNEMAEASDVDFDKRLKIQKDNAESAIIRGSSNRKELDDQAGQYLLSSTELGYINCDLYPLAVNGKSSFNLIEQDEAIACSLILHSVRGIASPRYIKQGKYIFPQLPNEEEVSVLAFKTENNKNYVSYYKTIHNKQDHRFEFEPLTKEKLNQITFELDAIKN
ncbi:MAG: hypothetical protein ACJARP_002958 [Vicingaceae bacterium]|jgi:hypothetical protein